VQELAPTSGYTGLKHHAKVHSFRIATALLAWVLIGAAFYYRPDLIKHALRMATRAIEGVGDAIPAPWGDRIEVILRGVGGFIWLQITMLIIAIRIALSSLAGLWRFIRRRDMPRAG
jgi:hypothetical protein